MFDALILRACSAQPLNLGELAETLFFYREVHITTDRGVLKQLLQDIGPDLLQVLLSEFHLKITHFDDGFGIWTYAAGSAAERYAPSIYTIPDIAFEKTFQQDIEQVTGRRGYSRRMAQRLSKLISLSSHEPSLPNILREDFSDIVYIQQGVAHLLRMLCPEYPLPTPLLFRVIPDGDRFTVETNIDFSAVNQFLHCRNPPSPSTLSPAGFLAHFATARADLTLTAAKNAELAVDPAHGGLIQAKIQQIIDKRATSDRSITHFQDMVLDDARAIAEVINGGERSFAELLPLLRTAQKFRDWMHRQSPDIDLAKAYFQEVTKGSWVEKLPTKTCRWAIFTGVGIGLDTLGLGGAGTAIATALGAADTFVLDKILRGWKPNQFVTGPLMKFVKSE